MKLRKTQLTNALQSACMNNRIHNKNIILKLMSQARAHEKGFN